MRPTAVDPVKLFSSVISGAPELIEKAISVIGARFGKNDYKSEPLPFDYTDYYEHEMGRGLKRKIISFERLINPDELPDIKLFTNSAEDGFLDKGGKRRVNIDPGYLTLDKIVMASCKNYSHRVSLSGGVYAEVTLIYRDKRYRALEWTYPDYREDYMSQIFKDIRCIYAKQTGRIKCAGA